LQFSYDRCKLTSAVVNDIQQLLVLSFIGFIQFVITIKRSHRVTPVFGLNLFYFNNLFAKLFFEFIISNSIFNFLCFMEL